MVRKMSAELEKAYGEVLDFIEESKPAKVRASFKRKQLKFLKADVKKPKVPFDKGMRRLEAKKQRRLEAVIKKQTLGNHCRRLRR